MPPEVVRTRASSTVFAKASSRVKRDFAGISKQDGQLMRKPAPAIRTSSSPNGRILVGWCHLALELMRFLGKAVKDKKSWPCLRNRDTILYLYICRSSGQAVQYAGKMC